MDDFLGDLGLVAKRPQREFCGGGGEISSTGETATLGPGGKGQW